MSNEHSSTTQILALFLAITIAMSSVFGGVAVAVPSGSGNTGTITAQNVTTELGDADDIVVNMTSQDGNHTYETNVTEGTTVSPDLPSGHTYNITISEPIHTNYTNTVTLNDGDTVDLGDITLAANGDAEINGELSTEGSEDSVYLQVNNSSGALVEDGTFSTGNYSIVVSGDEGPYNVTASAANHSEQSQSVSLAPESRATANFSLSLTQDGFANGTVTLNNDTGTNSTVELRQSGSVVAQQTNISSGSSYSLQAQPGEYDLRVTAPEYQNETAPVTITEGGENVTDFTLDLKNPKISGEITTERSDYTELVNVSVKNGGGTIVNSTDYQANGNYKITVPSDGVYDVIVNSSDHNLETQSVTIDNATDDAENVNFSLQASSRGNYEIEASTTDGGASSITVEAPVTGDAQTVSDGGKATFDLPTGDYAFEIRSNGYEDQVLNATVEESTTKFSSVTLQPNDGQIDLTIDSPNAPSTQDFDVSVINTSTSTTVNTTTVQNSGSTTFTLDPGEYSVEATATDYTTETEIVTVQSETVSSVTLSPYRPKNISTTLNLNNTSLASNGTVTVAETGNTYTLNDSEQINITGLRQGEYNLTAEADGHISQSTSVFVDSDGAEINFNLLESSNSTGFLGITVTSEDESASNIKISINETGQTFYTSENETIQVELPEDNYTVTANASGYNETFRTIEVTENSTNSVGLTLNNSLPDVDVPGVRIVSDNSYWVGQNFWRENLSNYSEVQWENQITTVKLNRSINSSTNVYNDSVQNITSKIGPNSDYVLYGVNASGNRTQIASVFLGVQTLNASFSPNTTSDATELNLNSNRGNGYEVVVTQDPSDTNTLNNSELVELFDKNATANLEQMNGTEKVVMEVPDGGFTTQLNMSEYERADYNFNFEVVDTPTQADAQVSLVVTAFEEEPDAVIKDDGRYWVGQKLEVSENINDGETVSIYRDNTTFVQESSADEFGVVQIRSSELGVGDYHIEDSDGNRIINFSLLQQTVSANFTDDNVTNGGTLSESGLTVDSNRVSYDLLVEAHYTNSSTDEPNRVEAASLAEALNANTTTVNETEYVVIRNMSTPQTTIVNFNNLTAGEYKFNVTPEDAYGNASANITVNVPVAGQAEFKQQFSTYSRGDVAKIGVTFGGDAENVTFKLGRFSEVAYTIEANLTKEANVDETTLRFDTSKAGKGNPDEVLTSSNENINIEIRDETTLPVDRNLAESRYLMELQVDNQTTDLATLNLFKAGVTSGNFYGTPPTVSSVGSEKVILNKSVKMNEIGRQSYVTLGFNVTGLETQLNDSDLTPADFEEGSSFAQASGISVNITKDNAGPNAKPQTVNMGEALTYHYMTPEERAEALGAVGNNTTAEDEVGNHTIVYFVFDGTSFNTDGDGNYQAKMNVTEDNAFVNNNITTTTNFTLVESETKFDRHWSDRILVLPESDQTLSGTTTLPPGTELTHEIRSENVRFPYYSSQEITVTENQTFNATYDLSSFPVGLEFNTSIPSQMDNKSVEVVSEIQPAPPEDMSNVTVFTQVDETPQEATVQLGNRTLNTSGDPPRSDELYIQKGTYRLTGTVEMNDTNATIDQTVAIDSDNEPIIANLNADGGNVTYADPRELPDSYNLNVIVSNENGEPVDGLVTVDGNSQVASGGETTFNIEEGTYTVSAQAHQHESAEQQVTVDGNETVEIQLQSIDVETPEPEETETPVPTSQTPGQPGFGVVISLIALLGAAFLVRRA